MKNERALTARLKPRPFKTRTRFEFFHSLPNRAICHPETEETAFIWLLCIVCRDAHVPVL